MASQNPQFIMFLITSLDIGARDVYDMRMFTRWLRLVVGLAFVSLVAIATTWDESAGIFLMYLAVYDLLVHMHGRYELLNKHRSRTCCIRAVYLDQVMTVSLHGALSSAVGAGVLNELVAGSVAWGLIWAIVWAVVLQARDVWALHKHERASYA